MRRVSRRRFIRSVAGTAAGATVAQSCAVLPTGTAPPSERVLVGVMGLRRQGMNDTKAFIRSRQAEIVALCDVDESVLNKSAREVEGMQGRKPRTVKDFRRLIEDKDIDALVIATPDHWHAIPSILACQSGKDVYVEKPLAHNIIEGRAMVQAARKYDRVVQMGTQQRSGRHFERAVEYVRSGKLGKVGLARAWICHDRPEIGSPPDSAPPPGVDYDMWLGPAPKRPFNPNRFHYQWHWFWDYGTGEMGNWGVHHLDIVRWGMNADYPTAVSCTGGKYVFEDMHETPDTQIVTYDYPGFSIIWEHRLWSTRPIERMRSGAAFYGSEATLVVDRDGWRVYPDDAAQQPVRGMGSEQHQRHVHNFIECVKSRELPRSDVEDAHKTTVLCHLGNIAFKVNRKLAFDSGTETFGDDAEANGHLGREYRAPWKLPTV